MKTFETPLSQIEKIYSYFHDPAAIPMGARINTMAVMNIMGR